MQHTVYQLTDAKVLAQPTPDGYPPPVLPGNLLLPWATGASAAGKKRKRVDGPGSEEDDDAASAVAADEEDDDDDGDSS